MNDYEDFRALTDVQWRTRTEQDRGIYIAEGMKTIERAMRAGHLLRSVITEERWLPDLLGIGVPREPVKVHTQAELESITGYHVHRGALAAFVRPVLPTVDSILTGAKRIVVVEDVVDHTNVGAILRSAAAFAIDGVLFTTSCADPLYRRAIKVSMGAVFAVPWTRVSWPHGMTALEAAGFATIALTPDSAAHDIRTLSADVRARPLALVVGTEGDGLSDRTLAAATYRVRIPMAHDVDSLNVAAAAAVACYEFTR